MKIGFIGAGAVGKTLAKYLNLRFGNVIGFYSRNVSDSIEASRFVLCEYYENLSDLLNLCDTLFLTVNDDSINTVVNDLYEQSIKNKIIIHTSGCLSSDVLNILDGNFLFSLHPIYAFNDLDNDFKKIDDIYFTIEGTNEYKENVKNMFKNVFDIKKEDKERYHAYLSMASNLMCSLIDVCETGLNNLGIDTKALMPLFINNANKICQSGSAGALTGPIKRGDTKTVLKHLEALDEKEREIYIPLAKHLLNMTNKNTKQIKEVLESYEKKYF